MAKLTSKQRGGLLSSQFALPKERKYPIENDAHAANAKARAKQQLNKGNLSKGQYETVVKKANRKLKGK